MATATAKERKRRYQDRKQRGAVVVSIEVEEPTIGVLQFKNYLDDDTCSGICTDKAMLAEAIQAKLLDWTDEVIAELDDAVTAA